MGWQVTVAPVGSTSLRIADLGKHDKAGEILIDGTESITNPRTETRIATETIPAIHLIHGGRMIDTIHLATAKETKVIRHFGQMRPIVRYVGTTLTIFAESEWTLNKIAFPTFHRRLLFTLASELLQMQFTKFGLRVKCIDMRRATLHHQENDILGFCRFMRWLGS